MKRLLQIIALAAGILGAGVAAEDPAFEKASLGWRTALHFDPGAEAPLQSLLQLYQNTRRSNDLLALYEQHVGQFPQDQGAKVVLARLYARVNDSRTDAFIDQAVAAHPDNALLAHVRGQWWQSKFDARALEELERAVQLEPNGARRAQWLGELMQEAANVRREEVAVRQLARMTEAGDLTPAQRLQWTRRCLEMGLIKAAESVITGVDPASLQGDEGVEARFLLGRVALALGNRADAGRHAAELLERLAPDHWRYKEALTLRWDTAEQAADREKILAEMEQRWRNAPDSESAAVSYGEALSTAGRKDDALKVWREALQTMPNSRLLEERVLELLEQLRRSEAELSFLGERLQLQPQRADLALRRVRTLLSLGRVEEGLAELQRLTSQSPPAEDASLYVQTSRWLRSRSLFGEASRVLESLLQGQPDRWEARKELAELLVIQGRRGDVEKLFAVEPPADLPQEVRMEVAQFLVSQKLWEPARRLLKDWLAANPAEFEGRLLLAKIDILLGEGAEAETLLDRARDLADTGARYAAWLAAAWGRAAEMDHTAEFVAEERARLAPETGGVWDAERLERLSLLAQQAMQPTERKDAEQLLRQTLAQPDLPNAQRRELRLLLIDVLAGEKGKEKELETEIQAALAEPGTGKGDLQLRLALMYVSAQRLDLARSVLAQVDAADCHDANLIAQAAALANSMNSGGQLRAFYERLVRLQPDEKSHWINWTQVMMDLQDEAGLRLALREIQSRAGAWKLSDAAIDGVRRHLAASYWRTVATLLADDEDSADLRSGLAALDELQRLERQPERFLWAVWARAMLARRMGDQAAVDQALAQLRAGKQDWVHFPDGLSLSLREAERMVSQAPAESKQPNKKLSEDGKTMPRAPLELSWAFEPKGKSELQRWDLTLDEASVLAGDNHGRLYLLDRATGRLRWERGEPRFGKASPRPASLHVRGGEQIKYPPEWAIGKTVVAAVGQDGLYGLSLRNGEILWGSAGPPPPGASCVAYDRGLMLWWRPVEGRLEAYDEESGKMRWSRQVLEEKKERPANQNQPQWIAAGMHAAEGRVLVWAEGGAVLQVEDGRIAWRARVGREAPAFPLELSQIGQAPSILPASAPSVRPWARAVGYNPAAYYTSRSQTGSVIFANTLASPGYGYPGMYGSGEARQMLTWGANEVRRLSGEGIWRLMDVGGRAYSVLGLPLRLRQTNSLPASTPVGFVGSTLVTVAETSIARHHPLKGSATLWTSQFARRNEDRATPAVALNGRSLLIAGRDVLLARDVLTGTELWRQPWPKEVLEVTKSSRDDFQTWTSMRWSGRGLFLNDGHGKTLTTDWKSLSAAGDWIIPAGTRALVCLRGAKPAVDSGNEHGVSD